ncbi:inositol monophosphatase family protein [Stackebrandtia soli]|uniref:inositol monophosphatase family protein n=1 Tax=Stackebrandtia soli TaxID=1892856 RepID=UPI0039E8DBC6
MLTLNQYDDLTTAIHRIADEEILTRFRRLTTTDIIEKHPGDLVTTADRRAEERLTETLQKALPGSLTVGEEATDADPAIVDHLHADTPVWIIDPVDGTSNFVNGDPYYSCLVSLAHKGQTIASWIYAPSLPLTAGALNGHGAWINNKPATLVNRPYHGTWDVVTTHHNYTAGYHTVLNGLRHPHIHTTDCKSAGLSYLDLIAGKHHALVYTWEKPWDHAAGLHIHTTLGGTNTTMDGTPFSITGANTLPFITGTPDAINALTPLLAPQT